MKEFWKEGLFVAIVYAVLSLAADLVPLNLSRESLFSPLLLFFGVFMLILPVFPSVLAGFWIRKKTSKKDYFSVPMIGAMAGGVLLVGFSLIQLMLLDDAALLLEMQNASGFGLNFFVEMSVSEFRSFLISSTAIGLIIVVLINGALGLAGGFIGGFFAKRKTGK